MIRNATGLAIVLPADEGDLPHWVHLQGSEVAAHGAGTDWPRSERVMLVAPPQAVVLHHFDLPDLPPPQGRAAARLMALENSIGPVQGLLAVAETPRRGAGEADRSHCIAVAARADIAQWIAWAHGQGLEPAAIVPAPLVLPPVPDGIAVGTVGGRDVLRGPALGMAASAPLADLVAPPPWTRVEPDWATALTTPEINLRQGEFAVPMRFWWTPAEVRRAAVLAACIAVVSVAIGLVDVARHRAAERRLDNQTLALAREVLPAANDPALVEAELASRLASRRLDSYSFGGRTGALVSMLQGAPGVALASLARDIDGTVRARLSASRAADIGRAARALEAAGFTVAVANLPVRGGPALADLVVRP